MKNYGIFLSLTGLFYLAWSFLALDHFKGHLRVFFGQVSIKSLHPFLSRVNWNYYFVFVTFLLLFHYSCFHFNPTMPACPAHLHLTSSNLPPLALSMCPFYMFFDGPSPIVPYYPSLLSSLVAVSLFLISLSLIVFCFLLCLVGRLHLQVRSHGVSFHCLAYFT